MRTKPELIARLRRAADTANAPSIASLLREAAAEVEELRCILSFCDPYVPDGMADIEGEDRMALLTGEPLGTA